MKIIAALLAALLLLAGCGDGLSSGDTKVTESKHGIWKAPAADAGCKWFVRTSKGVVIRSGKWTKGTTPTVVLGPKDTGRVFSTNASCGTWTKQ